MKGRVTGALFIIIALVVSYFGFDGRFFIPLFAFALVMAACEIMVITTWHQARMEPLACQPYSVWSLELLILFGALFALMLIDNKQLLFVVIVCCLTDVGAFAFGKMFGKHKVYALYSISPNKTIEGFIGGIVTSWIAGFVAIFLMGLTFSAPIIVFWVLCGPISELGDIIGSASKRQLGVKDSGEVLGTYPILKLLEWPLKGHGGYLDRLDSISIGIVLYAMTCILP